MTSVARQWPTPSQATVPYWVYTDDHNFRQELERIWYGPHWLYAALEAELPEPGSFRTTTLGERPVIVARAEDGTVHAFENRCAHRGVKLCQERAGRVDSFTCPYHQWNYALDGALQGVPFRRGFKKQGGMPREFDPADHGLRRLKVECVNGVIWASFRDDTPPFRETIGEKMWAQYARIFSGRQLRVIGYNRHVIPCNWKLMMENVKDPYHAILLHVFFATFGLYRPDNKSALEMDETGQHACLTSVNAGAGNAAGAGEVVAALPGFDSTLQLNDTRLIQGVKELEGDETVSVLSLFPSAIMLQQMNSLSARQIVPRGVDTFEMIYTHFGFEDDDDEMRARRARHANLFGPAGLVNVDDAEVLSMAQEGFTPSADEGDALILMGGTAVEDADHMATESAVRGMYRYYGKVMNL